MGDVADALIEQGEAGWWAHLSGDCSYDCQYCAEEDCDE